MFDRMKEDDIIQHIEKFHRSELVGLMTLYPEEWPYRMEKSFGDICGKNIAIDTDDLVLVNENVCVVIGTYGKRGNCAATNWKEHLGRRSVITSVGRNISCWLKFCWRKNKRSIMC